MFVGIWEETGDRAPAVTWAKGFTQDTERLSLGGTYVNLADSMSESKLVNSYGKAKYEKLAKIKAKYDPENVFRLNQNIKPKA
jgi:FAD/FMN-containing dehydrogenase